MGPTNVLFTAGSLLDGEKFMNDLGSEVSSANPLRHSECLNRRAR